MICIQRLVIPVILNSLKQGVFIQIRAEMIAFAPATGTNNFVRRKQKQYMLARFFIA